MKRKWSRVEDFDPNGQDPDTVPHKADPMGGTIHGRGQEGGGSKMTPQIRLMTARSGTRGAKYTIPTSNPSRPQKLRG